MRHLVEKSGVRVLVGFCALYTNKGFKEETGLKREKHNIKKNKNQGELALLSWTEFTLCHKECSGCDVGSFHQEFFYIPTRLLSLSI